jgi:hypothetical protein
LHQRLEVARAACEFFENCRPTFMFRLSMGERNFVAARSGARAGAGDSRRPRSDEAGGREIGRVFELAVEEALLAGVGSELLEKFALFGGKFSGRFDGDGHEVVPAAAPAESGDATA